MDRYKQLYDEYHINNPFLDFGKNTFWGDLAEVTYPHSKSVLDFGCGNGFAVKHMRAAGKNWYGLEYSKAAYDIHLNEPYFFLGNTHQFCDKQFDMGYSTEVFEHIPEATIEETIKDYCRVISKYMFMTISLRPSSNNNKYHCTLHSRSWWESKFSQYGFVVDRNVISLHQRRTIKTTEDILKSYVHFGPEAERFCANPPFDLKGEREPWFFCFRREGVPSSPPPHPRASWINRKIVPVARRLLLR